MNNAIELLNKAQDQQLAIIGKHRLAALKASDELRSFNGKDDYRISVVTIVNAYPEGIVLTKMREVLPVAEILDAAINALIEKKEIISEAMGKRKQVLKPAKKGAASPAPQEAVEFDSNPTSDPASVALTPAPSQEPTPTAAKNPADDAQ